jgi:hypothetical protein
MTEVIDRLVMAMNAHDLDAVTALIDENYRSVLGRTQGKADATIQAQILSTFASSENLEFV